MLILSIKEHNPILCSVTSGWPAKQLYLAGAFVEETFPSLVQSAEVVMFHVVCVTHRISVLVAGELPWQTFILATPKLLESCQADLWFGYAPEKH